jgi:hypothetical protein
MNSAWPYPNEHVLPLSIKRFVELIEQFDANQRQQAELNHQPRTEGHIAFT